MEIANKSVYVLWKVRSDTIYEDSLKVLLVSTNQSMIFSRGNELSETVRGLRAVSYYPILEYDDMTGKFIRKYYFDGTKKAYVVFVKSDFPLG